MTKPAAYLYPKELSFAVRQERGLELKYDRILAIRAVSESRKDGTFIDGRATVAGIVDWLRMNPGFRENPGRKARRGHVSASVRTFVV